jgi:hypothetical protein
MFKAVGGGISFIVGLLIIFQYLVVQKEETKSEMREHNIAFDKELLEFDKKMLLNKIVLEESMGNAKGAKIYQDQLDKMDEKIKLEELKKLEEAKKLEELKRQSEKILDDTNKTVEEQKLKQDFYK